MSTRQVAAESAPLIPPEVTIYDAPPTEAILDGTLNGLHVFTARLLVDRITRTSVAHKAPGALSELDYDAHVLDIAQTLAAQGLRTAIYANIGDHASRLAYAGAARRVRTVSGGLRPLKIAPMGDYLQSVKEQSRMVKDFNDGRIDVVVASRLFEEPTPIVADALIIAARVQAKHRLVKILANFALPNAARPNLTVFEMIELLGNDFRRATYLVGDVFDQANIRQGQQIGGYRGAKEAKPPFDPSGLPDRVQAILDELDGKYIEDVVGTAPARIREADLVGRKSVDDIAAAVAPHVPPSHVRYRLQQFAGLEPIVTHEEVDGELIKHYYFPDEEAMAYFAEHPVPQVAKPHLDTAHGMANRFGINREAIVAIIKELGDELKPLQLLNPEKFRERTYYDVASQALIKIAVAARKARWQAQHAEDAYRRVVATAERKEYEQAATGDLPFGKVAELAGLTYNAARAVVGPDIIDLPVLQSEANGRKPGYHVRAADIAGMVERLRRDLLPVNLLPLNSMAEWLKRSPRGLANHLGEFTSEPRLQSAMHGPPAHHYTWQAFRHVADYFGAPESPAFPIVWSQLPISRTHYTPEEESYARAVQVLLIPPGRMGAAEIMSAETARAFVYAVHEAETETVPTPLPVVETEPELVPEPEPRAAEILPEPIWVAGYAQEYNQARGTRLTPGDVAAVAQTIGAETDSDGDDMFLTAAGRQAMDTYAESLQPAPQNWRRITEVSAFIGDTGYETVRKHVNALIAKGELPGVGMYPVIPHAFTLVQYLSPEAVQQVASHFLRLRLSNRNTQLSARQIATLANQPADGMQDFIDDLAIKRQETYGGTELKAILLALGVDMPKKTPRAPREQAPVPAASQMPDIHLRHRSEPQTMMTITRHMHVEPAAVRAAIAKARAQLGPAFKSYSALDRMEMQTEHYADPSTLDAIEAALRSGKLDDRQ